MFCSQLNAEDEFWWPASSSVSLFLFVLRHDEHSESASQASRHPGGNRVLTEVYPWLNLLNMSCLLRRAPPPPTPAEEPSGPTAEEVSDISKSEVKCQQTDFNLNISKIFQK